MLGRQFTACVSLVEETGAVTTTSTTVAAACVVVRTRVIRRAKLSHNIHDIQLIVLLSVHTYV